jgi:hypothetical protein
MKKSNWSCSSCGMSAGRRSSVQRHIDNANIHNGDGRAVLLAGSVRRRIRIYQAPPVTSSDFTGPNDLVIKIEKELENQIVREIARRIFRSIPIDDFRYDLLESQARSHIYRKTTKGLLGELLNLLR